MSGHSAPLLAVLLLSAAGCLAPAGTTGQEADDAKPLPSMRLEGRVSDETPRLGDRITLEATLTRAAGEQSEFQVRILPPPGLELEGSADWTVSVQPGQQASASRTLVAREAGFWGIVLAGDTFTAQVPVLVVSRDEPALERLDAWTNWPPQDDADGAAAAGVPFTLQVWVEPRGPPADAVVELVLPSGVDVDSVDGQPDVAASQRTLRFELPAAEGAAATPGVNLVAAQPGDYAVLVRVAMDGLLLEADQEVSVR